MSIRSMGALLLVLPFSAAGAVFMARSTTASAGSTSAFWSGSNSTGVIPVDGASLHVEKEVLTISVPEFPKTGCSEEEFNAYRASVKTEYTFFNPTAEAKEATLVVPCGAAPDYAPLSDDFKFYQAAPRPVIAVGDVEIQPTARDSYIGPCSAADCYGFDVDVGLDRLYDAQSTFYQRELPVYVHTFEVNVPSAQTRGAEQWNWATLAIEFDCTAKNTRVFCSDHSNMTTFNGLGRILHGFNAADGQSVTFKMYAVNEDVSIHATKIYKYDNGKERILDNAVIIPHETAEVTFGELVCSFRNENCPVTAGDWYNGFVDMLEENEVEGCMSHGTPRGMSARSFMRWYEYKVEVPAKGKVVNTVTSPIYPSVSVSPQNIYKYVYLLSTAWKWDMHGGITINIETRYHLSDSKLDFEKIEGGYTLTRGKLPLGELTFSLTETERIPANPKYPTYSGKNNVLLTALIVLVVVAFGALVVVSVVYVRFKKRRAEAAAEKKPPAGRAVEGTIDLPPEEKK